jgi:gas vesicle protein
MNEQNRPLVVGFSGSQMMLAILGAAAAGAVIGYLTAPKSGVETRAQLKGMVKNGSDAVRQIPAAVKVAGSAAGNAFVETMREGAAS